MITKEQAQAIVRKELNLREQMGDKVKVRIIEESTIEADFGWVFFYNSEEFLDTGNYSYCLAGNAPFIVDREDGSLHVTGTAQSAEHYIEKYRAQKQRR
jgi:hypothetical protein